MKIIKEYGGLLTHWDDVMTTLVKNKQSKKIFALKTVDDFIDGFELQAPEGLGVRQLERLLKEQGLNVTTPTAKTGN